MNFLPVYREYRAQAGVEAGQWAGELDSSRLAWLATYQRESSDCPDQPGRVTRVECSESGRSWDTGQARHRDLRSDRTAFVSKLYSVALFSIRYLA